MKTVTLLCWAMSVSCLRAQTVSLPSDDAQMPVSETAWSIKSSGPHDRRWERISTLKQADGSRIAITNSFVELASGLNRLDENQRWAPAEAKFELGPQGAIAQTTAHKVLLAPSPTDPLPVNFQTSDGQSLISRVLGIAYYSPLTGTSAMIAEVRPSQGKLIPPNTLVYEDALDGGFRVDIRYTLTLAGLEQDLVILEQPFPPSAYQMPDDPDTRLELITEFIQAPQPTITEQILKIQSDALARSQMQEPNLTDQTLSFGAMQIGPGAAFDLDDAPAARWPGHIPVAKRWQIAGGRTALFEDIELSAAAQSLAKLPAVQGAAAGKARPGVLVASRDQLLPRVVPVKSTQPIMLAQSDLPRRGFNVDYSVVSSTTNFRFSCGTTYYVTNGVALTGTTVIEGGAVIKADRDGTTPVYLACYGPVQCLTTNYNPAIITARDDDTVGEMLPGSNGAPTGTYIRSLGLWYTTVDLHDLHISYGSGGIAAYYQAGTVIHDCQILNCAYPIIAGYGTTGQYPSVALRNVLLDKTAQAAITAQSATVTAEHATIRDSYQTFQMFDPTPHSLLLTNCIIAGYTAAPSGYTNVSGLETSSSSGLFQAVGGGNSYLAAGSNYRNVGTTNINPQLLTSLKSKTTYPPVVLANSTISMPLTLSPCVQRDGDVPDFGYHADPLDYLVSAVVLGNATLLLTNGVAVGYYGSPAFILTAGAKLVSEGKPNQLNRIVRYRCVQEYPVSSPEQWWHGVYCDSSYSPVPELHARFTDFVMPGPGGASGHVLTPASGGMVVDLRGCLFHAGSLFAADSAGLTMSITNCAFSCCVATIQGDTVNCFNNTFDRGQLWFMDAANQSYTVKDNLFDQTICTKNGYASFTFANNGYVTGYTRFFPTNAADVILTSSPAYPSGYYLPAGNPLIDKGSRSAGAAGLYHYTTQTNQVKEANTTVDIGFHSVASDSSNMPRDSDGDLIPDYFEDSNGDGIFNAGDLSDWGTSNSPVAGAAALQVFTPLK